MNRLSALTFSGIFLSAGFAATTGHAQIAPQGKVPVAITSDQLTGHNKDCEAIYSGNAEALQDTSRLRANVMNFFNKKLPNPHPAAGADANPTCGELDRMVADGNVYYVTPDRVVKGDHAVYTADNTTIVMTGTEVVATQGKNVISGTRLTINTTTGEATMVNEADRAAGAGAASKASSIPRTTRSPRPPRRRAPRRRRRPSRPPSRRQ